MVNRTYKPLTIPKIKWNKKQLTRTYGELTAEPLEPGFGVTLGNALRRVLLGGIEGSAVTSLIIKGVNNEFSSMSGTIEDALQIVLNCKQIIIRNKTGNPGKMSLHVEGEGEARVADIKADEHLELINTDHIIAHMAKGGELDIEFFVESGRGYQTAQWPIDKALQPDNRIYIDAMFSPVTKVSYHVEKTRVGGDIDYDKLILGIHTDGSDTPVDVLHYAVSVLRTQLEHFLTEEPEIPFNAISVQEGEAGVSEEVEAKVQGVPVQTLLQPIDNLNLSVRAHNCLVNAGITRVIELVRLSDEELQHIKNFGKKSYDEVKDAIQSAGLTLGMDIDEAELKPFEENYETSNT